MAANNYFGFPHGTTQYAAATGTAAYQTPQAGYAVAQTAAAAAAASYNTQRAATGYDTYQQAHTTPATYAVAAAAGTSGPTYDYTGYARTAATTPAPPPYDTSKTYYQPAATPAQAYTSPDYQGKAATYNATYTTQAVRPAGGQQHKAAQYAAAAAAAAAAGYTTAQAQPQPNSYTYTTPQVTTGANFNGSTVSYTNSTATTNYSSAYSAQNPTQTTATQKPKAAVYSGGMYMNQGAKAAVNTTWQGYKKPGGVKQMRTKPQPKPQQLHYCEVCKISCAGPQTYREHLEGQRHKKKEAHQKEGSGPVSSGGGGGGGGGRGSNNLRCELCDVVCTGTDAYAAHLRGAKHQKVVKLHTKLGKPIPEVDMKTAKAAAAAATGGTGTSGAPPTGGTASKISFVQSGTLGSVKGEKEVMKEEVGGGGIVHSDIEMVASSDNEITPVGQEYIEEIKNEEGKLISFNCKLCECKFNDPNAKDMHMKGRRHRLQFKKKVNPDLVVDVKPSGRRGRIQEEKIKRRDDFMRRRDDERSFWTDRLVGGDDRLYWEERRRFEEEIEFMEWIRRRGPGPPGGPGPNFIQPPPLPYGIRRPETIDDRHFLSKHQAIYPKEEKLQLIHKFVSQVEKALKIIGDQISLQWKPDQMKKEIKEEVKDDKIDDKPDCKTNDDKDSGRLIRGIMRVGNLPKNLLLADDNTAQLVILCSEIPTKSLLTQIYNAFQNYIKTNVLVDENVAVSLCLDEACFTVSTTSDPKIQVIVSITSPVIRELLLQDNGGNEVGSGTVSLANEEALDEAKCLEALAQLRRAKWFQARPGNNPSSVMVIRILRDLCNRNPTWAPLSEWARELLVDRVVSCVGFSGSEALRKVLEAIAGGILLPGSPGIADPCEREPTDAASDLNPQQRADITASAQHALRLFAFRQIHKVLGIAQLLPQPRHTVNRGHGGIQRFNRKRRRDHSAGENFDSEVGDGKKDKKEGEGDVIMESASIVK